MNPNQELHVPRLKPAAPDTWEVRESLSVEDLETSRIPLVFPGPYLIVGAHCTVIPTTNTDNLKDPTTDDLMVLLDLDNKRRFTGTGDMTGQASSAARNAEYVTLSSLDTDNRDLHIELRAPKPVIGVTFRWKIITQATREALYQNCMIGIAFYCVALERR